MRKLLVNVFVLGVSLWVAVIASPVCHAFNRFLNNDTILTQDDDDVVGAEIKNSDEPLRDGSHLGVEWVDNIYNDELTDTQTSREKTTRYIKGPVNYFLWIVWLVALIYLLYHGFQTLISGSNEDQQKKWIEGMKYGAIALIGVGVAWFILSLIFRLINLVTNAV